LHSVACPQQGNNYDCGIFVVIFAEHIATYIATRSFNAGEEHAAIWTEGLSAYLMGRVAGSTALDTRRRFSAEVRQLAQLKS
jgi:Ulp1 family protease